MSIAPFLLFIASILACGFFAGYETGFVSANLFRIRHLAEKERNPTAVQLTAHYENPNRLITMLLVGTNLSLVIGTIALTHAIGPGLATLIATPVFLIVSEIMPKSIFRHFPTKLILAFFPVVRICTPLLAPITIPVAWLSQRFLNLLLREGTGMRVLLATLDDMRTLVDESHDQGTLDPEEHEMIHSVIDLQTQRVQEIMVPRIQIQALPETASRHELTELFIESGRTRLPIYSETIDQIIGVVNVYDVIKDPHPELPDIKRFIKPVLHIPDSMKLHDALKALRKAHQSLAIVTDEHGGTDGVITVEDILEEIFGEIHDEYDIATTQIRKIAPDAYVIDAQTPLHELGRLLDMDMTEYDVETVGGWVNYISGNIPQPGEIIVSGNIKITVLEGMPTHVVSIRLDRLVPRDYTEEASKAGT